KRGWSARSPRPCAGWTSSWGGPRADVQVAPVLEVGGACALARDHRRAERRRGRAARSEGGAGVGAPQAAQHESTDADGGFLRDEGADVEAALGVERAVLPTDAQARLGDPPHAPPLAVGGL